MKIFKCAGMNAILVFLAGSIQYAAAQTGPEPVSIPLTMYQKNVNGVPKPRLNVTIGNLPPLPFGFDTGSSGLHVWAAANLTNLAAPGGSGVNCTNQPTSVTYGNPARIIMSGVVCYAQLTLGSLTTPSAVPIAYLTSARCLVSDCQPPNLNDPVEMGGYGVFGAGLTGIMYGDGNVPNPILTFPEPYGSLYNVQLTQTGGALVLGSAGPPSPATFHFQKGNLEGETWSLAQTCLLIGDNPIGACMEISFDTGNPSPWIHNPGTTAIPECYPGVPDCPPGFVVPGTRIGFAPYTETGPAPSPSDAIYLTAGTTQYVDQIAIDNIAGEAPITNVSIHVFFGQIVTYDNKAGTISFAPAQ